MRVKNAKRVFPFPFPFSFFRLDRALSVGLFGPLAGFPGKKGKNALRIPILMYHSVSREAEPGVHPYYRVVTTPEVFARHMELLAGQGYQVIGLEAANGLLRSNNTGGQGVPPKPEMIEKPVVITFDDGFLDFYTGAFPVLAGHGFTATVFLPTAFIGGHSSCGKAGGGKVAGKEFLSWRQVRELADSGISFGSHSVSHCRLVALPRPEVEVELRRSKEDIEAKTGHPAHAFSYPYAFPEHDREFTAFLRGALKECGYACAVTTSIGTAVPAGDPLFLKRLPVNDADDDGLLLAKMNGGYDWLHAAQYAAKKAKRILGMGKGKNLVEWTTQP